MKKIKVFTLFVVCCFVLSYFTSTANVQGSLKNYEIKVVENPLPEQSAEKVWSITYSGCEMPVTVIKRNTGNGAAYIVSTKFFEVCYACTPKRFGTVKLKNSWRCIPFEINQAVINQDEVNNQHVITPHQVNDETALDLIACYLPNLLNEQYAHLLN